MATAAEGIAMKGNSLFLFSMALIIIAASVVLVARKSYGGPLETLHRKLPEAIHDWRSEPGDRFYDDSVYSDR